jgi:hypothetical protein
MQEREESYVTTFNWFPLKKTFNWLKYNYTLSHIWLANF